MNSRMERLEESAERHRKRINDAIWETTFAAIDETDFPALRQLFGRLDPEVSWTDMLATCTPEEVAAAERLMKTAHAAEAAVKGSLGRSV